MDLSRRNFLTGAGFAGLAVAGGAMGLTGCSPDTATESEKKPLETTEESQAAPIAPAEPPAEWDKTADAVIVGAGMGGMAAALLAAEKGKHVIVVEKEGTTGGSARHASAWLIGAGGTKELREDDFGWPTSPFDLKNTTNAVNQLCQYSCDDMLQYEFLKAGGECTDWLLSHKEIEWTRIPNAPSYVETDLLEGKHNAVLGMTHTMDAMEKLAIDAGVEILTSTKCEKLVLDGDRVAGVLVNGAEGESYIKAEMGVILCSGGMGMNLDLLKEYIPTAYRAAAQGGPMPTDTGDGFRMGLGVGADWSGFDSWCCWDGALDDYWGDGDGGYWHYFWNGARQVAKCAWPLLDKRGERVPYYSLGVQPTYGDFVNTRFNMGDLPTSAACMSRIGHRAYAFFDADFDKNIFEHELWLNHFGEDSRRPLTPDDNVLDNGLVTTDWRSEFEEAVERGAIKKADTIEELAEQMGLKPEKIKAGIERWNELCAQGEDLDLIVPYPKEWLVPVENPPFYGAAISGQIGKTLCGLRVDKRMQVITTEGDPIPGLYANFHTAGGEAGESNFGSNHGNASLFGGFATSGVSGYLACKNLLAG